jgi:hypothetical protein
MYLNFRQKRKVYRRKGGGVTPLVTSIPVLPTVPRTPCILLRLHGGMSSADIKGIGHDIRIGP